VNDGCDVVVWAAGDAVAVEVLVEGAVRADANDDMPRAPLFWVVGLSFEDKWLRAAHVTYPTKNPNAAVELTIITTTME
jgi:hypothetical protein